MPALVRSIFVRFVGLCLGKGALPSIGDCVGIEKVGDKSNRTSGRDRLARITELEEVTG